ncbi:MAG: T9SS type A sorting domain-containing protein [Candidatus Electryonea clarkiae]|nr:T9SS type A sorting domain-containing protein [Candidatus Electryonea clarkiae]MDP8289276.1 T9SS type A sorting domain-containing protein [Candidatus Electryonea clarkiae]
MIAAFQDKITSLNHIQCVVVIFILIPFLSLNINVNLYAQTEVEGDVYGVWDEEGSPYLVMDTLIIPEDSTLTIEPGVTVEFQDQDEDQYPFYIHGTLEAIGEEGDSVYFTSPDSPFPGFGMETGHIEGIINLEYCVIDSARSVLYNTGIHSFVARHSSFFLNDTSYAYRNYFGADTIEFCDFYISNEDPLQISMHFGGPYLFQNNSGGVNFNVEEGVVAPVYGNRVNRIYVGDTNAEIYDNNVYRITGRGSNVNIHDNTMSGPCIANGSIGSIENNIMAWLQLDGSRQFEVCNNYITGPSYHAIWLENSDVIIENNIVISNSDILDDRGNDRRQIIIRNNTFVFDEGGIEWSEDFTIVNNIFVGDGVNCPAIDAGHNPEFLQNVHYNVFYNVSEVLKYGDEDDLDTTNYYTNPRFNGGEPFDYHLQANSPCIDTGDPDSPDDPDDTRADIGAFFYDQSIDNPPALISPFRLIEQAGTEFSYTALAIDDDGPLTFHFENLPDWLEEDENILAWVADSAVVSGTIPDDIEEFEFDVIVEDGLGQIDSTHVYCEVIQYSILRGITNGVITTENSPYLVVEDVIVPAGDTLSVEPGCAIYFNFIEQIDQRLKFKVYGILHAEGTEEDSIIFTSESDNDRGWLGIWLLGSENDSTILAFTKIEFSEFGILGDSNTVFYIDNSNFINNRYSLVLNNGASGIIERCNFLRDSQYFGKFIELLRAEVVLRSCHFEVSPEEGNSTQMTDQNEPSTIIIDSCTFVSAGTIQLTDSSRIEITRSKFISNTFNNGIYMANPFVNGTSASGLIANNIFTRISRIIIGNVNNMIFSNNIIRESLIGLRFVDTPINLSVVNNIFVDNVTAIKVHDVIPEYNEIQYNSFYNNDTTGHRCEIDSTNILIDPLFIDTLEFRLQDYSLCNDRGHPDSLFNDHDGSRNDMGIWGGPFAPTVPDTGNVVLSNYILPPEYKFYQPYPNPFNGIQIMMFDIPVSSDAEIKIFNILGREVFSSTYLLLQPGRHEKSWNATKLPSGLYFIRFKSGAFKSIKKVILIK